jgi:cyclophilin family peptidyl-prolyl cis-trans isomerase
MRVLTAILLFAISFASCSANDKKPENQTNSQQNSQKEVKMDRPKYEITAFQSGKELGKIIIETFPDKAPKHAANFDSLVAIGFYDGTAFHRVIPGFMIQGGDPNSKNFPNDRSRWGMGDPSQTKVPAEFNANEPNWSHKRGILSAARSNDPNSASSQFFLMNSDAPHLDGQYSIYGQVLEGMEVVDVITAAPKNPRPKDSEPVETITMKIVKLK